MKLSNLYKNSNHALSEKLIKSEMRYRRLFETAKDGILLLDYGTGRITDANPYIADIIGLSKAEIVGKELWEIGLFSNKKQSKKAFAELKTNNYIRFEDMPVKQQNGKFKEVEFISNVYLVGNTKVIQCNIREITQRKRAEKNQEVIISILSRLNAPLEWQPLIKDILIELKNFTGIETIGIRLRNGNEFPYYETKRLMSDVVLSEKQICSKPIQNESSTDKDPKPFLDCICNNVFSGQTDSTLSYYTKGGSFFSGNTELLIDNRATQNTSGHLPCNSEEYKSVAIIPLHSGNDIIGLLQLFDTESNKFSNEAIELFEKIGNSIGIAFNRIQNENKIKESEQRLIEKNKEYISLNKEYLTVNTELSQTLNRIHLINEELTKSKIKAEESDRLKSAFLSNMSHEIRTPMNAIMGFSDLLLKNELSEEKIRDYTLLINVSGQQLLSVISDVLDMSRIEVGEITITSEVVDIKELMNELLVTYKKIVEPKNLNLHFSGQNINSRVQIKTDGNRIKQILCNLLNNAIKFTEKGDIRFGYEITENSVLFYVEDEGIGIAPENFDLIFQRFSQLASTDQKIYGGNGLGLCISKALVEKLGGNMEVNSEPGVGSRFSFSIPYVEGNEKVQSSGLDQKIDPFSKWNEKTLLIVEDDSNNHALIEEILLPTRIKLKHAWNGREAVKHLKNNHDISLILMDINMPVMDGYEAVQHIKQMKPEIPVVAITAYAQTQDKKKTLNSGFDYYLSKPINFNKLLEVVKDHLF